MTLDYGSETPLRELVSPPSLLSYVPLRSGRMLVCLSPAPGKVWGDSARWRQLLKQLSSRRLLFDAKARIQLKSKESPCRLHREHHHGSPLATGQRRLV